MEPEPRKTASRSVLRTFPRPVWVLLGAAFVNRVGLVVMPMLALSLRAAGWSERAAIAAGSLYALGATISSLPAGLLSDRLGRRRALALVTGATGLGMVLLGELRHHPTMLLGVFAVGLVAEAYRPSVTAMLTDLVDPSRRLAVFALHRTVVNLGYAVAPLLAGLVAASQHYGWLFWINGLSAAVFAVVALLFLPETRPEPASPRRGLQQTLKDRRFVAFCTALLPAQCAFFQVLTALPIYLRDSLPGPDGRVLSVLRALPTPFTTGEDSWGGEILARPEAVYGLLMFVNALLIVCFEYRVSLELGRWRLERVMAVAAAVIGIGLALFGLMPSTDGAFMAITVVTLGQILFAPTALAFTSRLAPKEQRAQYMAFFGLTHGVALVVAPLAASLLLPLSPERFFMGAGLLSLATAPAFLALRGPAPGEPAGG